MPLNINEEFYPTFKLTVNGPFVPQWIKELLGDISEVISEFEYEDSLGATMDSDLSDYLEDASNSFMDDLKCHFPRYFDPQDSLYSEDLDTFDSLIPFNCEFDDFGTLDDRVKQLWLGGQFQQITNIAEGLKSKGAGYVIAISENMLNAPYDVMNMPELELHESEAALKENIVAEVAEEYTIPAVWLDYDVVFQDKCSELQWGICDGAVYVVK